MLIPLKSLISILKEDSDLLHHFLSSFSCTKDKDIEYFLHNRAIEFENLSKSRTYLVCSEEQLINNAFDNVTIFGYISIALKVLTIPEESSNRTRKELDGFCAKNHGHIIRDIPCYLIGQLSRNSNISSSLLPGSKLIEYACNIIAQSVEAVGGRFIMIECLNEKKLIRFYQENHFNEIARIPDKNTAMVQMIRKIY